MSKVKIFLDENETLEEAELDLLKALNSKNSVNNHSSFEDPAMNDVADRLVKDHEKMFEAMLKEIFQVLEQDYQYGK